MSRLHRPELRWPETLALSLVAALTTWLTLLSWAPFAEVPSSYLGPLAGGVLLVAGSGALLRAARLPAPVVLLAQTLLVATWLHRRWAEPEAWGGWLPTADSLARVRDVLAAGAAAARSYPAPVPEEAWQFAALMIVTGLATALVVDLLACGLRRAPVAGLPLLAAYTAPVSILAEGVSWPVFVLAATAFLALLVCQEAARLARWGRPVSVAGTVFDTRGTTVSGQAVWSSARRIGLTATGLSVLVPLAVPTLSLTLFEGAGPGSGAGGDPVRIANPIVNMRRDLALGEDVELLRVRTDDPEPTYLRISVLDSYDGESWRPGDRRIPPEQRTDGLVPRPPGLDSAVTRQRFGWTVEADPGFESRWLPAPYPVFSVSAAGDWRYDRDTLDFLSADEELTTAGLDYQLQRLAVAPTTEQLRSAPPSPAEVFGPSTELPEGVAERVRGLAREVTEGARSSFEEAVALQQWFRVDGGFTYSLARAPGNGIDDLERFLRDEPGGRTGYCEQFAAAMAIMGRSIGIPSRVAVGFLRPDLETQTAGGRVYVYSSRDLHAWPEMYFEGVGWVRFEPTPGGRTGLAPAYTRESGVQQVPTPTAPAPAAVPEGRFTEPTETASADAGGAGGKRGSWSAGGVLPVLASGGALGVAALVPRAVRALARRRRWAAGTTPGALAEAAWDELRATAVDLGLSWPDGATVRTRARGLLEAFGRRGGVEDALARASVRGPGADLEAEAALARLVELVEMARYARRVRPGAAERAEVLGDVAVCCEALRAGASRRQRKRARWWPASVMQRPARGPVVGRAAPTWYDVPGVDRAG